MGARTGILKATRRERLRKGLLLLAAAAWLLAPPPGVQAEDGYDPDHVMYATGAVFESESKLADKARMPLFRAFLPPATDLRDRLPRPGEQREQGSYVGWAHEPPKGVENYTPPTRLRGIERALARSACSPVGV